MTDEILSLFVMKRGFVPRTAEEIANRLGSTSQSVSNHLVFLQRDGLVKSARNGYPKVLIYELTDAGKEHVAGSEAA